MSDYCPACEAYNDHEPWCPHYVHVVPINQPTVLISSSFQIRGCAFQTRTRDWCIACFGEAISNDKIERNHRFLEESLELVQSLGCTKEEAIQLVDYVYSRPEGEPVQELGGVMVTVAALSAANQLDMEVAAETELNRVWGKMETIRAKQAAKPKHSPLP